MAGTTFQASGVVRWVWCSTIADINAPTAAEVAAGVDLTCDINATNGFELTQTFLDDPSGCSKIVGKAAGQVTLGDPSIDFKLYWGGVAASNPLIATLARGEEGFLVTNYSGDADMDDAIEASDMVNVWKVVVGSHSHSTPYANELAKWTCSFGVQAVAQEVAVV